MKRDRFFEKYWPVISFNLKRIVKNIRTKILRTIYINIIINLLCSQCTQLTCVNDVFFLFLGKIKFKANVSKDIHTYS